MMNCPICQHTNPKRSTFCQHCGNRLKVRCPQCDRLVRVYFRFCNRCGFKIAAAARPPPRAVEPQGSDAGAPQAQRPPAVPVQPGAPTPQVAAPERAAPDPNLQRLIPKELLSKLDAARAS